MKIVKFCNIKNIYETRTAGVLEIPFLGFHIVSPNDWKRIHIIKDCVKELRSNFPTTKAILVSKETDTNKLIEIIKDIEFDGIQLHYPNSNLQAAVLKNTFGKEFIVIQVITSGIEDFTPTESDFIILDKSYVGGTGTQQSLTVINKAILRLNEKKVLLAGGISPANIYEYLDLPIHGFDIQSAIKSDSHNEYENTNAAKVINTAKLLGYVPHTPSQQVGFAIQDIQQQNQNLFMNAFHNSVDFFHIDITDGFIGTKTDILTTTNLLTMISNTNSHIRIQIHMFISSEKNYKNLVTSLGLDLYPYIQVFIHINRDNYKNFSQSFINKQDVFFSIDVGDVTDDQFPLEQFIKSELILCLQSNESPNRIENLNKSLKLIRYSTKVRPIITIDRSITYQTLLGITDVSSINIVCGSYLRENLENRYSLLKDYLRS